MSFGIFWFFVVFDEKYWVGKRIENYVIVFYFFFFKIFGCLILYGFVLVKDE